MTFDDCLIIVPFALQSKNIQPWLHSQYDSNIF